MLLCSSQMDGLAQAPPCIFTPSRRLVPSDLELPAQQRCLQAECELEGLNMDSRALSLLVQLCTLYLQSYKEQPLELCSLPVNKGSNHTVYLSLQSGVSNLCV